MKSSIIAKRIAGVVLMCPLMAGAVEWPQVKPGLWEVRMQSATDGAPLKLAGTQQICWDAETLANSKKKTEAATKVQRCAKSEMRKQGNQWIAEAVCKEAGKTVSSHSTREFSGENAYHDESTRTYDPPSSGRSQIHIVVDGKWRGPC